MVLFKYEKHKVSNRSNRIFFLVLGALLIFFIFVDFLEENANEIINKNLWIGVPLVIIEYLLFKTIQGRFCKKLLESDCLKNKIVEGQKEIRQLASWFILII